MLFNSSDVAVDTVNIPALAENEAYVRRDAATWAADARTTPGMSNTEDSYRTLNTLAQHTDVIMVELMASNTQFRPDEYGVAQDYVMLRNTSNAPADIGGWFLSDDPSVLRKWRFPKGTTVPAGGALVVYCDGSDRIDDPAHPHTNFGLSSEGETVTLSNVSGQPVDAVTYDLLRTDTAYLRGADGSWAIGAPQG